ncbi:MAG: DUF4856 domain-containing protein [Proteobacteria bacterium]|nr:DUF4856 domain-containing protein [Pseudomonadota bacterium]
MRHLPLLVLLAACTATNDDDPGVDSDSGSPITGIAEYAFDGRDGSSSVSYSGQVFRQVLIADMKSHMGGLTDRLNGGSFFPTEGVVEGELAFYVDFDSSVGGTVAIGVDGAEQGTYDDISSGKDLRGKLAGNDSATDHQDWITAFAGWDADGVTSPETLVDHWISVVDAQAVAWNTSPPLGPDSSPVPAVYVTPEGQDLQQLLQKFLLGAITFSQGADDYLDDDVDGKGLLADHTALVDGKSYTALEHAWDEGFGYFGAARTTPSWTLDEIADGAVDVDGSGSVDLLAEMSWGHSVNAAKRDRGAVTTTDFVGDAWTGFSEGRALIASTDAALTDDELATLKEHRDLAVLAWEKAIASTVVHYINDVLVDTDAIGTDDYSFGDAAKHWSEMKGFALSLQFSPHSPMTSTEFATLHDKFGTGPVLETATSSDIADYRAYLLEARALLGDAYGFDAANLGDTDGLNGW